MTNLYRTSFALLIVIIQPIAMSQSAGDRLRITTTDTRFDGFATAIDSTGFNLKLRNGSSRLVPHADVVLLERHMRTRSYRKEGLLIGAGVGVAAGIIAGLIVDGSCTNGSLVVESCDEKRWADGRLAATIWGSGLGLSGYVIGAVIRSDEWQPITTTALGSLRFYPTFEIRFMEHSASNLRIGLAVDF